MPELDTQLPAYAKPEAEKMAKLMESDFAKKYKLEPGVKFCYDDMVEMYLANTWKANLSVTGAGGLPYYEKAGNVVRASTSLRLSMRLPPNKDAKEAGKQVREKLSKDVPHNCVVEIHGDHNGNGWCMKDPEPWFHEVLNSAAKDFFDNKEYGSYGMGGSIPFLSQLGGLYPDTFIVALGLLGPQSNAHAPNESINLAYAKKLTCCMSHILVDVGRAKK